MDRLRKSHVRINRSKKQPVLSAIKHRQLNELSLFTLLYLQDFNANAVVDQVKDALANYKLPIRVSLNFLEKLKNKKKTWLSFKCLLAALRLNFVTLGIPI